MAGLASWWPEGAREGGHTPWVAAYGSGGGENLAEEEPRAMDLGEATSCGSMGGGRGRPGEAHGGVQWPRWPRTAALGACTVNPFMEELRACMGRRWLHGRG